MKKRETEKTPHKMISQEKTPQEKTPKKSPVEKTPHPFLGLVEKTPHPIFRLVEKTPQLYKKPSLWNFDISYLNCIQTLTPPLYKKPSYWNFDILAFVPPGQVKQGMDYLNEVCPEDAEGLVDYFDST